MAVARQLAGIGLALGEVQAWVGDLEPQKVDSFELLKGTTCF